jgi:Ca-activated chloride channel family protein
MSGLALAMPHLLRPWWLLALPALPLLGWLWQRHARSDTPWKRFVDAHLLPSLLQEAPASRGAVAWLFAAGYLLAVLALCGPAWPRPVPVYTPRAPLVVVQDMSSHMLVSDLAPSRLLRVRLKVQQLIAQRKGGQLGLVAYAGDAFTVAPLSEDGRSLSDLVVALAPDTMPVDGQHADRGLRLAVDLLAQAGYPRGTILLLSDGADAGAIVAAREAHAKGYEVDAVGVGTRAGAPLPAADGTFAQDGAGALRVARLDADALRSLALSGGGRYAEMTTSSDDLAALDVLDPKAEQTHDALALQALGWSDGGPFVLLLLLPLAALAFRRGWLVVVLLAVFAMPGPPARAAQPQALEGLWQRRDQQADAALRAGDAAKAAALAQTPAQRAAAAYRKGDYAAAVSQWASLDDADANYNRGNALAQMQRFDEAIDAYRRALSEQPRLADARANLDIVRRLQKKQQQDSRQDDRQQRAGQDRQQQDPRKQNPQGQSKNQENMQRSQQQAQQQGQQRDPNQPRPPQASPKEQASAQDQDVSQQPRPDPKQQAKADAAEKRAIQQALLDHQRKDEGAKREALAAKETTAQREQREATETLLRRVPDDPGSLLRRKFALEYARRQQAGDR